MRFHPLAALLLAGAALPAAAQDAQRLDRRVGKLEQEMRAVQRRVFPGGNVEPEIRPAAPVVAPSGVPGGSAVTDLTARVDALESQLAALTGQVEQNGFRVRQLEEALNRFRADAETRLKEIEARRAAPASAPETETAVPPPPADTAAPEESAAPSAPAGDPIEAAYTAGYRLWNERKYGEAQKALEAFAKKYPRHARASWALNLAGRAYLDDGKPATAAKLFLQNYQTNPKGERAADSLLFLGEALMQLKKPAEACQVYAELQDVYGPTMRDFIRQRLPKARADAKCG